MTTTPARKRCCSITPCRSTSCSDAPSHGRAAPPGHTRPHPANFTPLSPDRHRTVTFLPYRRTLNFASDPWRLALTPARRFSDRIDQALFDALYARSLVYNTCWEDPAVDRLALELRPEDTVLAITSAGCNVLDYALTGPRRIWAVDANPRQTALLELKLAGIRRLDFDDFFALFGAGNHPQIRAVYGDALRPALSPFARRFWDDRIGWFDGRSGSFYFHGLSGLVARAFRAYLAARPRLAAGVRALFETASLDEQRQLFDARVQPELWGPAMNWTLSRPFTMSLLGVPHPQRREVRAQHERGIAGFIRESVEYVFRQLPARTNYFWAVYVHGRYAPDCCPEYLKRDNFEALKDGLVDRVEPHTGTVTAFLQDNEVPVSRFVLLDHMDWMASYRPAALAEEWRAILARATPDARIIFRSAHAAPAYLDDLDIGEGHGRLREALRFDGALARRLQDLDRVHTYAGFHIAEPVHP